MMILYPSFKAVTPVYVFASVIGSFSEVIRRTPIGVTLFFAGWAAAVLIHALLSRPGSTVCLRCGAAQPQPGRDTKGEQ